MQPCSSSRDDVKLVTIRPSRSLALEAILTPHTPGRAHNAGYPTQSGESTALDIPKRPGQPTALGVPKRRESPQRWVSQMNKKSSGRGILFSALRHGLTYCIMLHLAVHLAVSPIPVLVLDICRPFLVAYISSLSLGLSSSSPIFRRTCSSSISTFVRTLSKRFSRRIWLLIITVSTVEPTQYGW